VTPGPTSQFYFSHRLKLHYVNWGNDGASPLLLLHGGLDHCRNWDWVAQRMRDRYHIIAPDLRGHGDSGWSLGGTYSEVNYIYDVAQLIHQRSMAPVTIIAHSLGGSLALLYAGIFPATVHKIVAIEGMGPAPHLVESRKAMPIEERMRRWIQKRRENAGRSTRKYATLEDAVQRMREENQHLNAAQAHHLTLHGAYQNEDGTYSWKFDNCVRYSGGPGRLSADEQYRLMNQITCPVLLVRGTESWASDPVIDGRAKHLRNARLVNIDGAGHWVHHDRLDVFMEEVEKFLRE
jgi:pimeloyl-ACP methyl ester carboxylesterase